MKLSALLIAAMFFHGNMLVADPPDKVRIATKDAVAVVIAFPEKDISIPTIPNIWNGIARLFDFDGDNHLRVGHAGLLIIDPNNGTVKYVDFGRYDERKDLPCERPENYGVVRTPETVPELRIRIKARFQDGVLMNLDSLLVHLAAKPLFRSYGRVEASEYHHLNLEKMVRFIEEVSQKGYVRYGCPNLQYCSKFARQVIRKGGGRYSFSTLTGMQMVRWNRKNL